MTSTDNGGTAGLQKLAEEVLAAARARNVTLGSAESCTGGMIAATLTDIAGSSDVFVGGVVSYWAEVKEAVLGVDGKTIQEHGVVSSQVAEQMAEGASRVLSCDYAVSTTGIAGPGGAEPGKPVGTVWLGLKTPAGVKSELICADGGRGDVRRAAVKHALGMLMDALG